MKTLFHFSIFALLTFLVSCSSIFNGSKDEVTINSNPIEAEITIDGMKMGVTPKTVELKRGKIHVIEIRKSGFESYKIATSNSIAGWFWGNLLCGGVIGMVIDLATGNAYDVDPDVIDVTLNKGTGMLEKYYHENFTGIQLKDERGNKLAFIKINWK